MFSEREDEIIKIIGRRKIAIRDISEELFRDVVNKPFDCEIGVGNSIRRIMEKCQFHELDWTFEKERHGRKFLWTKVKV